jgi:hypothetical protein
MSRPSRENTGSTYVGPDSHRSGIDLLTRLSVRNDMKAFDESGYPTGQSTIFRKVCTNIPILGRYRLPVGRALPHARRVQAGMTGYSGGRRRILKNRLSYQIACGGSSLPAEVSRRRVSPRSVTGGWYDGVSLWRGKV